MGLGGRRSRVSVSAVLAVAVVGLLALPVGAGHDSYRRITAGQINGNATDKFVAFLAASSDGSRALFSTNEQLVAADTDNATDIYERRGGRTTLVSVGAINGNSEQGSFYQGSSTNGLRVFFRTDEQLVASDTDSASDIYQRFNGVTTRVSVGAINGNGPHEVTFSHATPDGSAVFFQTNEQLASGDNDDERDLYKRANGKTKLMSGGGSDASADFMGASTTGKIVVFLSNQQITANDDDESDDLFMRQGTTTTRVSIGTINGNGDFEAEYGGMSADGSRIFFETDERLLSTDTDDSSDVYQRLNGQTTRLTLGPNGGNGEFFTSFLGSSADGTRVFFTSPEQLVTGDTDSSTDIYMRQGTTTTLISDGQINGDGAFNASFRDASTDGTRVFFVTEEQLTAGDGDAVDDIYMRQGTTTTLISDGQVNGDGAFPVQFAGIDANGSVVAFETDEVLHPDDGDAVQDVYSREDGETFFLSLGNDNALSHWAGTSTDGSAIYFSTFDSILPNDTDEVGDIYGVYNKP